MKKPLVDAKDSFSILADMKSKLANARFKLHRAQHAEMDKDPVSGFAIADIREYIQAVKAKILDVISHLNLLEVSQKPLWVDSLRLSCKREE